MIGQPIPRREDARILRGQTRYLDDIEPAGVAHVAFVRSPYAHARVTAIARPARADGLVAVLTAADLEGVAAPLPIQPVDDAQLADEPHPILARDEVRYAGQAVAAVVAESRALAEDIAELVEVDYVPLPAVVDARGSDLALMRWSRRHGDVEGAFAQAAHVVSGRYALPRLAAVPIEARGAIAQYDPVADGLAVWCSVQDPHRPRQQLAHVFARSPDAVRVIVPDVGGAFGSKGVIAPEVAVAAAAAMILGRPVKWVEDRLENLLTSYQGRGIEGDVALALDPEGRMLALRARLCADLGGYLLTTTAIPPHTAAMLITGCYDIAAADVEVIGARTHKVPTGPYRGAGRPDAAYMVEALVDRAARQLGIDRVTLRRRNLIRRFPHRTPLGHEYDSGDYERCLDMAVSLAREAAAAGEAGSSAVAAADGEEIATGTGIALYVERAGGQWESAAVALRSGGGFEIASSANPHGQGHDITFAQIAADRLGCGLDRIALHFGDSATVPPGVGTFGSRSVAMAGSAIVQAADELVARARTLAATQLDVEPDAVGFESGAFSVAGGSGASVDWAQLGDAGLRVQSTFRSPTVFSSGAYAATVEIDRATGGLRVRRVVAVDDAGTVINPLLVHGQILGGAVQALGECLVEEVLHDSGGQNLSGSLLSYSLLTAAEIPPIVTWEVSSPSPHNPLGAKGAGEGGAVGTLAAVANAVVDALGGHHVDPPFTDEKLWRALQDIDAEAEAEAEAGGAQAGARARSLEEAP